jgi:4-hydroxy-3-polyprenylbenzoate decarboxylase
MAYKNLREFINLLEKGGQLARIKAPVDSHLEITEITDRISKGPPEKNKALLFENVVGSDMPVLINMFGSPQRMAWALGVRELEGLNEKMAQFIDPSPSREAGPVLGRAKDMLGALRNAGMRPKMVKNARMACGRMDNIY